MKKQKLIPQDFLIYKSNDGLLNLNVKLEDDMIWLTQAQMVELFGSSKANINEHIKQIYRTKELAKNPTVRKFRTVQNEGKRQVERRLDFYNLDIIIAVGYRVNSKKGTQFRIWANQVLKEYLMKGFVMRPYMNIGEQLGKFKNEIIYRIELLEKDNQNYNQQVDEFFKTLESLMTEINKMKSKNVDVPKRTKVGYKFKNEE